MEVKYFMVTKIAKYEYKIIPLPKFINEAEEELNKMSSDMWETVNFFNVPNQDFKFETDKNKITLTFILLKRIRS
jgi:hypothetical protein